MQHRRPRQLWNVQRIKKMEKIKIKIKKIKEEATIPKYAHPGDAGLDLHSTEDYTLKPKERRLFKTGLSIEIPEGYVSIIKGRSGLAYKKGISILGGVIEYTYRGEYGVIMLNTSEEEIEIKKEDRIAQLLILPIATAEIEETKELSKTMRGEKGFGSTG